MRPRPSSAKGVWYDSSVVETQACTMKTILILAMAFGSAALAQSTPVYRQGQCPTGTYTSGSSCVPVGGTQVYWNGGGSCPLGWTSSKGYCVR